MLANEYYQLLKEDKEYLKKYKLNFNTERELAKDIINFMENSFEWRKIQTIQDVEKKIRDGDVKELLRIEDYYMDEISDLMGKHLSIELGKLSESEYCEIISDRNLNELLEKKEIPDQLKDSINIYFNSRSICEKLYNVLEQGSKNNIQDQDETNI